MKVTRAYGNNRPCSAGSATTWVSPASVCAAAEVPAILRKQLVSLHVGGCERAFPAGGEASEPTVASKRNRLTSPPDRLCRERIDLTVLIDRDNQPLLRVPTREPAKQKVQPMPAHDHRLHTAPRFNPISLRRPTCQVRIESRRARVGCFVADHRVSAPPGS
jgi:hypothetical protein